MPAVLGQSTSFALNGPPFTSMANQQNAATNRGDRASACDEVACVKTALGFNKKKSHPVWEKFMLGSALDDWPNTI